MLKHIGLFCLIAAILLVIPVAAANASTMEKTNFITVQSSPPYADVYVDKVYQGKTPVTSPDHLEGYYEVRVVLAGYDEYIVPDLHVSSGSSRAASVTANLIKNSSRAGVVVYTEPAGVMVYVDDVYAGTTPELKDGGLQLSGYPSGQHTFRFEKDGYSAVTKDNYVLSAGTTATLRTTLGKAAPTTVPVTIATPTATTATPTTPAPPAPTKSPAPLAVVFFGLAGAALLLRRV